MDPVREHLRRHPHDTEATPSARIACYRIIAQAVRSDRLPRDFLADTQTPPTTAGDKNSPEDYSFEAIK